MAVVCRLDWVGVVFDRAFGIWDGRMLWLSWPVISYWALKLWDWYGEPLISDLLLLESQKTRIACWLSPSQCLKHVLHHLLFILYNSFIEEGKKFQEGYNKEKPNPHIEVVLLNLQRKKNRI